MKIKKILLDKTHVVETEKALPNKTRVVKQRKTFPDKILVLEKKKAPAELGLGCINKKLLLNGA